MADKKKISVADILAAARASDRSGGERPEATPSSESSSDPSSESSAGGERPAKASKPVKSGGDSAGRPSVTEMLAKAREEKAAKPAGAAAAAAPVDRPASPARKAKPAKTAKDPSPKIPSEKGAEAAGGPKRTTSILAAARQASQRGPVSKAAAKGARPEAKAKKPRLEAPPMPAKPTFAAAAAPKQAAPTVRSRRRAVLGMIVGSPLAIGFSSLATTLSLWTLAMARFMFPNVLREPPSQFKVGFPSDFAPGQVETKFKAQFGVWVVNGQYHGKPQIYALRSVCTHLGCTPNWLEAEQKYKCPCHGSGFYKDGINFEGPAPRPLERYAIHVSDDGQIEIDKSTMFQEEMGQWEDPESYIAV